MSRSLIDRYTYGHSSWPAPFTPEAEILLENPRRQNEMLQLAQHQIEVQKAASRAVVQSNIAGAQIISNEIAQQTRILENMIGGMTLGIAAAADQISDSIDILGDRLCAELAEIRWQLSQQNESLEKILDLLRNSRNNEAQQLVKQGVRHYVHGEYLESEERFRKALDFDTTDYQVLMNLAYIEMHKGNSETASTFFKKSLNLPENLDSHSKARTLWALGRLSYAENDYQNALSYAEQAIKHNSQVDPQWVFTSGIYAAQLGKDQIAVNAIEEAIQLHPDIFARAYVEPELAPVHDQIQSLLSRLSQQAAIGAKMIIDELENEINSIKSSFHIIELSAFVDKVDTILRNYKTKFNDPSYADCIEITGKLSTIRTTIKKLKILGSLYLKRKSVQKEYDKHDAEYKNAKYDNSTPVSNMEASIGWLCFAIVYLTPIIFFAKVGAMPWVVGIIWPILFVISLLGFLVGSEEHIRIAGALFKGLIVGGIIAFIINFIRKNMEESERNVLNQLASERLNKLSKVQSSKSDLENIDKEIKQLSLNIKF